LDRIKQNFTDFDVMAVGPVAKKVSASLDIYWNNQWAYPGEALLQNDQDQLYWKAGDTILRREPARTFWQRFQAAFFGLFDLDDQL
jgi:hypothetical protein